MIKIDDIQKLVQLVLLSGYLRNSNPLSILFIGKAGIGKTELSTAFRSSRAVVMNDLSKTGVYDEIQQNKKLKHIIIPDFIKITQKRRATSDDLVSTLNAATEEGLTKISLFSYKQNFKGKKIGIITSTTKASFAQHRRNWEAIGFVSRMLICSFSYADDTIKEIMSYIEHESYLNDSQKQKIRGMKDLEVKSTPELNKQLEKINENQFRKQKQLQTLLKCNAILRGDNRVIQEDVDEILRLSKYLNLNYTKI